MRGCECVRLSVTEGKGKRQGNDRSAVDRAIDRPDRSIDRPIERNIDKLINPSRFFGIPDAGTSREILEENLLLPGRKDINQKKY